MSALAIVSTLEAQPRIVPHPHREHQSIKPLYKWAGGKTKLLKHYRGKMPSYDGFSVYIEPFFGGGAVFCDVVNSKQVENFAINDINSELIAIYQAIKNEPEEFITQCCAFADEWNAKSPARRKTWYYKLRTKFWKMVPGELTTAATLYVLMKTSFNGVWQPSVANGGKFGTAVGLTDKATEIDADLIRAWSAKLQSTTISAKDYRDIEIPANPCLIYCDPPYRGSTTSYGQAFDDRAQKELVDWCRAMSAKGHTVILANRDCGDGFFDEISDDEATVHAFDVKYTVGRKKKTDEGYAATEATEFIAIFEGQELVAANDADFDGAATHCDTAVAPLRVHAKCGIRAITLPLPYRSAYAPQYSSRTWLPIRAPPPPI